MAASVVITLIFHAFRRFRQTYRRTVDAHILDAKYEIHYI